MKSSPNIKNNVNAFESYAWDSFRRGSRIWNSKNTTNFIQMDSQVICNGFLRYICEIYRDHCCKNSDHYAITILSEV